jgi:hypothetical protein
MCVCACVCVVNCECNLCSIEITIVSGGDIDVTVKHTGVVEMPQPILLKFACSFVVNKFPFDKQVCYYRTGIAPYANDEVHAVIDPHAILNPLHSGEMKTTFSYETSIKCDRCTEFYIRSFDPSIYNMSLMLPDRSFRTYELVQATLTLERKPGYYWLTLVLPTFIIVQLGIRRE